MKAAELAAAVRMFPTLATSFGDTSYRCAVRLTDGLYLPCVAFRPSASQVDAAIARFEERYADSKLPRREQIFGDGARYRDLVELFVTGGNRLWAEHVAEVTESLFAIAPDVLGALTGETSMSWTQFTGVMRDGREFAFGTTYHTAFFDMPPGYRASDVVRVIPHDIRSTPLYRERPFFECFLAELNDKSA